MMGDRERRGEEKSAVFCYGSNSLTQLCGRVGNEVLHGSAARLHGWVRTFGLYSARWKGAVASIAKSTREDAVVYGSMVFLSEKEIERLDAYEGGYEKVAVEVVCGNEEEKTKVNAMAYVAVKTEWTGFPSEQYLTAIRLMLSEFYPPDHDALLPLEIWGLPAGVKEPIKLHDHRHPAGHSLTIPSIAVLANRGRDKPWAMPAKLIEIEDKLAEVDIHSAVHLGIAIVKGNLNSLLEEKGLNTFDPETIQAFAEILGIEKHKIQDN